MTFSLVHTVRQPAGDSAGPAPLLVLLHGVGSNEHDLMGLAPALDPRFLIVSARAPLTLGPESYGWYRVQFTADGPIIDTAQAEQGLQKMLAFVEELVGSYNVDPDRVYLMGFSQGCIMSVAAALSQPRKFAGVVGMSGRLLPGILEKAASREELVNFPAMIVHGTEDRVLPIAFGREIKAALENLEMDLTYREYPIGHSISQQSFFDIVEWFKQCLDK